MPLFQFRQNNSGGRWIGPKVVVVRAPSAGQANQIAQEELDNMAELMAAELDF